ncbi:MAG: TadE/TadG family type IV pilus assembly protein, partial [Phycisphaerae bacterium]
MAIVLPVFFMLIFAAVEFFRLSMLRQYAENVSYEAARTVIVPGGSATEATAVANDMLNKLGIKNAVVTVTPPTIADSTGKITVSTELAVDNLNLAGTAITSTDTNGNIDLTPNGTGEVNISKVDIDAGAIDGTAIGANSASTGAFTTLSATGVT